MKILKSDVNWLKAYSSVPIIKCLVDKIPRRDSFIYTKNSNIYWSQSDGFVSFYYHNPSDETGFGGTLFKLKMDDGSEKTIKGPWSSRPGIMNKIFPHSVEIMLTDDEEAWNRGFTFINTYCTLNNAIKAAALAGTHLVRYIHYNEISYHPSLVSDAVVKPFRDKFLMFNNNAMIELDYIEEYKQYLK